MKPAYYSEWEPYPAQWLRNLIKAGLIPAGDVDERDIREVQADDLRGYGQKHLFAGIGGFAYGARLAGIPDDFNIITGGPPCQPTSVAGAQRGEADPRYLWPEMDRLVAEVRPAWVFYENPTGTSELSIDRVCSDLEGQAYEVSPIVLPACAVDAPHRRDRVWIVGHAEHLRDAQQEGLERKERGRTVDSGEGHVEYTQGVGRREGRPGPDISQRHNEAVAEHGIRGGFWDDHEWIQGGEGKWRRVKPGIRLLASRVSQRVRALSTLGNAINPYCTVPIYQAMMS